MLRIHKINKQFGNKCVLKDLSIKFSDKGVAVIVGLNGSGKSVFLNTITGLLSKDSGEITLNGSDFSSVYFKERIFLIPSDSLMPEYLTGKEYAEFILPRYPNSSRDMYNRLIDLLGMAEAQKEVIESYSFGMKKKIQIAIALSLNVDYLLADEVFSGLDFETVILVQEIIKLISKKQKIVLVSHEENIINCFSEEIYLMKNGKLRSYWGSAQQLSKLLIQEGRVHERVDTIKELI